MSLVDTWGPSGLLLGLARSVALVEALDAATGVDQLLLAGEVRVALVAEFDEKIATLGAARREGVAARALDVRVCVVRVDVGLHGEPKQGPK